MEREQQAVDAALALVGRLLRSHGFAAMDGTGLLKVAAAGYLAGSGVPTDEAVQAVEQMAARGLVSHVAANPLYAGIPWMVPGPVSGAPYYR